MTRVISWWERKHRSWLCLRSTFGFPDLKGFESLDWEDQEHDINYLRPKRLSNRCPPTYCFASGVANTQLKIGTEAPKKRNQQDVVFETWGSIFALFWSVTKCGFPDLNGFEKMTKEDGMGDKSFFLSFVFSFSQFFIFKAPIFCVGEKKDLAPHQPGAPEAQCSQAQPPPSLGYQLANNTLIILDDHQEDLVLVLTLFVFKAPK